MGSPLSAVMVCLNMEMLEKECFSVILPNDTIWLRYVDDVLVLTPSNTDTNTLLNNLNSVNDKIQFTVEEENDGQLPYLDTVIIKSVSNIKFKVYRKPTNKDDLMHYYSGHDKKTKSGVVLSFFFVHTGFVVMNIWTRSWFTSLRFL